MEFGLDKVTFCWGKQAHISLSVTKKLSKAWNMQACRLVDKYLGMDKGGGFQDESVNQDAVLSAHQNSSQIRPEL